ncbi:hypothetical protein CI105_05950 [Candidatus Izimaplasma bacterium ZiA1]|uniref:helix-turn-helix domain-containing protein n=1 Tax=Candidatus Izimoplasma sp. ZiA1 TaxID=2024899 RepID=UPI000BAA8DB6|nr:hypothetical protein CI105_05950 [Candidatus Izimaplasma bacterium ZiA1]
MENNAKEFALFIDGIRINRNLSRDELIEGIMSISQYKRYLRGDTSIPNSKLIELADKLNLSIHDLHFLFRDQNNDEYKRVLQIHNLVTEKEYQKALNLAMKFDSDMFIYNYNKMFYEYCVLRSQHAINMVSDVHVLDLYSTLIQYPDCENNESFNFVEISTLLQIALTSAKIENYTPVDLLYRILSSDRFRYSSSVETMIIPSVYSTLASILGIMDDYDKIIEITNLGIDYCIQRQTSNALPNLYYFNAIANLDLGNKPLALESARKCFMALYLENKPTKFDGFKQYFEEDFKMKLDDLIKL